MKKQSNYDGSIIYNEIKKDIQKQKTTMYVGGFLFFILLMLIVPIAFWFFFGAFIQC